jgi:XTP/dITP diphosphohydrolase
MQQLTFVTGNELKFRFAEELCSGMGVQLTQADFDMPEIQSEIGEVIARDKANKVFEKFQKPIVITDDSWIIPGLGGFPGPYMKSVNHWFTPEDWLRLTLPLEDREIILHQIAAYQDEFEQVVFAVDITGVLLTEIRGTSKWPHNTIVSFDGGKQSDAEAHAKGQSGAIAHHSAWHELCKWLKERES